MCVFFNVTHTVATVERSFLNPKIIKNYLEAT